MTIHKIHPMFTFREKDADMKDCIRIGSEKAHRIPENIYGNFFEHLGFAIFGGVWAQILANPVFHGEHNLSKNDLAKLLEDGEWLTKYFTEGGTPQGLPRHWLPGVGATGFGVAILDDATSEGIPLPWKALSNKPSTVVQAAGRIGHGLRLISQGEDVGVAQGVFLPTHRVNEFEINVWARLDDAAHSGELSVRFRRRVNRTEILASTEITGLTSTWRKYRLVLTLEPGTVGNFEPVDFCLVWNGKTDLLLDRVELYPADHINGFDCEVVEALKAWQIPLLRWPGGNFVSDYHWRDGIGAPDLRPTRFNSAWGGLEYNAIGTDEFMQLCELIGATPHICVNIGTGTPEEAAAWVEYCNGGPETVMGRYRIENGVESPYDVKLWEVGNEIYGCWQIGNCGSEENARRYREFSAAMKAVDPSITLIATGNPFDFVKPEPHWSFVTADGNWHESLFKSCGDSLEFVSLHALPENERRMESVSHEHAHYGVMAHPLHWERTDIPNLKKLMERYNVQARLAVTEWGVLGTSDMRPRVENLAEAIYAGLFLNFLARNALFIPIANATAVLHGGCIRKAAERVYIDAQYWAIKLHQKMAGYQLLPCEYIGSGYNIDNGTETTPNVKNVPYVDVVSCIDEVTERLIITIVNRSLRDARPVTITLPDVKQYTQSVASVMCCDDPFAVSDPLKPDKFKPSSHPVSLEGNQVQIDLPPCSLVQIDVS